MLNFLNEQFIKDYNWILTLVLQCFIAYHIFYLWKKIGANQKIKHRENIKNLIDKYLYEVVYKKKYYKVYLLNIDNYFNKYPKNEESIITSYSHFKTEIKTTRYDWVEFFESMPIEIYRRKNGKLYFNKIGNKDKKIKIFPVWIVPYDFIDHINFDWDEYNNAPLIFCKFNKFRIFIKLFPYVFYKYPYSKIIYYKENENYNEKSDPYDFEYIQIREPIYK